MKKYLILTAIILISLSVYAQPKPHVDEATVKYENFKYQPVLIHTFEIKNIGDQNLEILKARPT